MGVPGSPQDASQFIKFAMAQMGDSEFSGPLSSAFQAAANNYVPDFTFPNFWQVGCVFDTMLDYFRALDDAGEPYALSFRDQVLAEAVFAYQYGIVGMTAAWYDDWSWWGIAASKAFDPDYEDIFGGQLEFFQSAAMDLWGLVDAGDFATVADSIPADVWSNSAIESDGTTKFTKAILSARGELHIGTRNAWALIERGANGDGTPRQNADYAYFAGETSGGWAVPRFPGGCWQYDLSSQPFPRDDGPDWSDPDPKHQQLGVFQLTLMPGLYLSFCCSLWAAAERKAAEGKTGGAWDRLQPVETYRQRADEVVTFLANWLELPGPDSLAAGFAQGALVHERTPTYAALSDGSYPPLEAYFSDIFWGGDQGLIMGALMQYGQLAGAASSEAAEGTAPPVYATCPSALLTGVFHNMPAEDDPDMVGPFVNPELHSPISNDPGDYGSGSGVFWRYVMRCCRLDPGFAEKARSDPRIVAVATRSGTTVNGWGNDLFQPFNTVAAAIGAWYLLK